MTYQKRLPDPVLVAPPNCACRGRAPQMREHTAGWCSMLTTEEINAFAPDDPRLVGNDPRLELAQDTGGTSQRRGVHGDPWRARGDIDPRYVEPEAVPRPLTFERSRWVTVYWVAVIGLLLAIVTVAAVGLVVVPYLRTLS